MEGRCKNLGIFGGTFNPVHLGHLRLAEDVREEYALDRVLFIPANVPPHKRIYETIDPGSRLKMVERAITGNPSFSCDDIELRRGGVSYTIDTVEYVYDAYAFDRKPFFILGSDLLGEMRTWKNVDRLLERVMFVALLRDQLSQNEAIEMVEPLERLIKGRGSIRECFSFYTGRKIDITSSEIREKVARGESIRYLVPEGVFQYIIEKGLYRKSG